MNVGIIRGLIAPCDIENLIHLRLISHIVCNRNSSSSREKFGCEIEKITHAKDKNEEFHKSMEIKSGQ